MRPIILFLIASSFCLIAQAKMAFQKQIGNQRLIAVADDNGKNQQVISDLDLDSYHPEIDSSGRYVAYSSGKINPGKEVSIEMVIADLETKTLEAWTPKDNQYIHAEFSGNGKYLAFSGPKNSKQLIHVIDLEEERKKSSQRTLKGEWTKKYYQPNYTIIDSKYDCYAPAVSSDGTFVIYHRTLDSTDKKAPKQLMYYNLKTKQKVLLTEDMRHAMFPSLSADDRYITFVSTDSGQWDIYIFDLWTQEKRQLTNDENMEFTPSYSDDGSIFYTRFDMSGEKALIDIYKIPAEQIKGGEIKPLPFLADPEAEEYVPSFSNSEQVSIYSSSSLLPPARSSFGAIMHEGKVYVAGGHQGPEHTYPKESFLNNLESFDLTTKTWQQLAPMNVPKHGFQLVAHGNYLYTLGGFAYSSDHLPAWKSLDIVERYDIQNDKWEILPTRLPQPRSSNAVAVVNNKAYLLGGWNSTPKHDNDKDGLFLAPVDVFDFETEQASRTELNIPKPLRRALTSVVIDNKIVLLGGISEGSSHFDWLDKVTVLDAEDNSWSELPPLPFATFAPGAGVKNNKIYLFGGMVLRNKETFDLDYVDDIYNFDFDKNQWDHAGVYLNQNKGFPQIVNLPNDSLGILGGHTYQWTEDSVIDHPVADFEVLK